MDLKLFNRWIVKVNVNRKSKSYRNVSNEVPQRSVLCPMLFNIVINDMEENIKSLLVIFVDDTKVGGEVNDGDRLDAQADLDHFVGLVHLNHTHGGIWAIAQNRMHRINVRCRILFVPAEFVIFHQNAYFW